MTALLLAMVLQACGAPGGADTAPTDAGASRCSATSQGLLITELLPDPVGPDAGHEWLELTNTGAEPICLDGAVLHIGMPWAPKTRILRDLGCLPPEEIWLLTNQNASDAASNSRARGSYGSLLMPNTQGTVAISCDGTVLDAVEYGPTAHAGAPQVGRALARVPMAAGGLFCTVSGEADAQGNVGSPGAPNPGCATCRDAGGLLRLRRPADPDALSLDSLEPYEADGPFGTGSHRLMVSTGAKEMDLAGLALHVARPGRPERRWQVPEGPCQAVAPYTQRQLAVVTHAEGPAPAARADTAGPAVLWGSKKWPRGPLQLELRLGDDTVAEGRWQPGHPAGRIDGLDEAFLGGPSGSQISTRP